MSNSKNIDKSRLKSILQGLMRYRRVNNEDMDILAHVIGEYLNNYIQSNSYTTKDKPVHEALEYYIDTCSKHYDID